MNRLALKACLLSSPSKLPALCFSEDIFYNNRFTGYGCLNLGVSKVYKVNLMSNGKHFYGFNTYSEAKDLSSKKCVPCNSKDIRPMSEQSAQELLPKVAGWNLLSEGNTLKIQRSWKVKSFTKGLEFFQIVGDVAEAEGHHPDLHLVGWNNVKIEIWTHSVGGLTENDFILAAKINALNVEPLLRRRVAT